MPKPAFAPREVLVVRPVPKFVRALMPSDELYY
jgi:hypothetical protein